MSNVTVTKQGAESMRDNPAPGARQEYVDRRQEYRPAQAQPIDFRALAVLFAGVALLVVVLALVYAVWKWLYCWSGERYATCQRISDAEPLVLAFFLIGGPLFIAGVALWRESTRRALERAEVARASLALDRWGNPVAAEMFSRLDVEQQVKLYWSMLDLASKTKVATAPYETLPQGLNTYSPNNSSTVNPAALLEAGPDIGPLAPTVWLPWLDRQPHGLFAAKTGEGKSTITKYGLKPRIEAGEDIFIIDPHSSGWFDLPGVGGGENWSEVEAAMMTVYAEYKNRAAERERHKRDTGEPMDDHYFPRVTVLFDEANNARTAFARIYAGSKRRYDPWPLFTECLSSGARKLNICIWLLVQSALVEDLGLSGSMRQNFTRIALDLYTIRQMVDREETDGKRKEAIYAGLPAQYPATAIVDNKVYILDRTGINQIQPPRNSAGCAWQGWDYRARKGLVTLADDGEDEENNALLEEMLKRPISTNGRHNGSVRPSMREYAAQTATIAVPPLTDGRTDGRTLKQDRMKDYLKALAAAGKTRDEARAWAESRGLRFENRLWTQVRDELGLR